MNFLRALLASLLSLACTLAVSGFVTLQTVNATLLDRAEVKSWLADSGVYNNLLGSFFDSNTTAQQQLKALGDVVSPQMVKTAITETFPTSFVQQSTEDVLDGTYNWLDSKSQTIEFEVNLTGYKETFVQKLSAQLEPQIAALPRCTSPAQFNVVNPSCLPPGTTAKQASEALAIDTSNHIDLFDRPLNTSNINNVTQQQSPDAFSPANPSKQIPQAVQTMRMWLVWLPLIAIVSGVLMVLLSRLHFKAAKHLAGRLTFGLAVTFALGLIVANVGKTFKISEYASASSSAATANIVEPILHQAAPAVGNYLAMVSGIAGGITFVLWIVLLIIHKRREKAELLKPAETVATPAAATPAAKPSQTSASDAPQQKPEPTSPPKAEQK